MGSFYLLQRGYFNDRHEEDVILTGCKGVVTLEDMKAQEFAWNAVPKSFRRIMYFYRDYYVYSTRIRNSAGKELLIFARRDRAYETIEEVRRFINLPWELKAPGNLCEAIYGDTEVKTNFWWCIDIPQKGNVADWMAFFDDEKDRFNKAIGNDYNEWWLPMEYEEKESEYNRALSW